MYFIAQLLGSLILTLLGFVIPLFAILLSLFPEGTKKIKENYENEKNQNENNLATLTQKGGVDLDGLQDSIDNIKKAGRATKNKLNYLEPSSQLKLTTAPLFGALLLVLPPLFAKDFWVWSVQISGIWISSICIVVSLCLLARAIFVFWKLLLIFSEVTQAVNESRTRTENKIIELLTAIVEKSDGPLLFLDTRNITVKLDGQPITKTTEFAWSANKEHELPISIVNSTDLMAKYVEVGLEFPQEFLVEKTPNIDSIYKGENIQTVRFAQERVHSHENNMQGKMKITPIKAGKYDIRGFIKGENVKNSVFLFSIKVVD